MRSQGHRGKSDISAKPFFKTSAQSQRHIFTSSEFALTIGTRIHSHLPKTNTVQCWPIGYIGSGVCDLHGLRVYAFSGVVMNDCRILRPDCTQVRAYLGKIKPQCGQRFCLFCFLRCWVVRVRLVVGFHVDKTWSSATAPEIVVAFSGTRSQFPERILVEHAGIRHVHSLIICMPIILD